MKTPIKALRKLDGKKRYIAAAIIAAELLSLPAAAHIIHRVTFETKPHVVAVEVPTAERGLSRFLVTSNDAFGVNATNLTGNVKIKIRMSGTMAGGQRFGDAAQFPGDQVYCAQSKPQTESPIYMATRGTALEEGSAVEQAVIFEFHYDIAAEPEFTFSDQSDMKTQPSSCIKYLA